jgi:1,4-dihydroxy-2-naphthoate octaprenyltransferase
MLGVGIVTVDLALASVAIGLGLAVVRNPRRWIPILLFVVGAGFLVDVLSVLIRVG